MKAVLLSIASVLLFASSHGQKMTVQEYIDTYKNLAVEEMLRAGVPAAITLAQGLLETENGNSDLVKKSNNHFGIKCKAEWVGQTVYHDDDESGECFRKYDSAIFSYRDHSDFLRNRSHYAFLFSLDPLDYRGWAFGLKKAGYATNPRYPEILIKSIEENNLNVISEETFNKIPDYSVFVIETKKSSVSIIDRSIKKVDQILDLPKINARTYNGLKVVYADSGMSLLAIATRFDIPLSDLLDYNDLIEDGLLKKSAMIYLQRKRSEGLQPTYQVQSNENAYAISQKNSIQLSYLLAYNGLNENDTLKSGTVLQLKSGISTAGKTDEAIESTGNIEKKGHRSHEKSLLKEKKKGIAHRVRPGETLADISNKYKVSVNEIKKANHLKSSRLRIGQKLIITK